MQHNQELVSATTERGRAATARHSASTLPALCPHFPALCPHFPALCPHSASTSPHSVSTLLALCQHFPVALPALPRRSASTPPTPYFLAQAVRPVRKQVRLPFWRLPPPLYHYSGLRVDVVDLSPLTARGSVAGGRCHSLRGYGWSLPRAVPHHVLHNSVV